MYNTLTVGVYGMIESKKPPKIHRRERNTDDSSHMTPSDIESASAPLGGQASTAGGPGDNSVNSIKSDKDAMKRMKELEK